ncbi:hypothetical protein [Bacteroides sp.]|uniref:hypothetical protein n=1 Tax=Bacteroides sp. TaxID=29523 RepID=UPI0025BBF0C5|nr:hypothetical protein [Bacteroides sp.]
MDIVKVSLSVVEVDLSGVKVRLGSAKENGGLVQLVQKFTGLLAHTHVRTHAFYNYSARCYIKVFDKLYQGF